MAKKSLKSLRSAMNAKLGEKTKESAQRASSASSFRDYFTDTGKAARKWWADKGEHIMDIIPYTAGKQDPKNAEGDPVYVLDLMVHQRVGPLEDKVVCLEQYGNECPICAEMRRLRSEQADYDTQIKPLRPSRRALYNVVIRDGGEQEKKGVQLLEIAHWFMEKHLVKISKDPRSGGYVTFSSPDEGKSISFERSGGKDNTSYDGHRFVDRLEPITDDELGSTYCIDELIVIKDYDEVFEMFNGKKDKSAPEKEDKSAEPEEEKMKPKKIKKLLKKYKKLECPEDGTIGEDFEDYDECDECKLNDECEFVADHG